MIKKIAAQALDKAVPYTWTTLNYDQIQELLKVHGELIVKECIDIAQDRANFPGYPPNDVNDIIDEIREHFGVEE